MKGTIRKVDRKQPYQVRWRDNAGREHARSFEKRKHADKFLTKIVGSVHDGSFVDTKPVRMGDLFDRWLADSLTVREQRGEIKPSTAKSYRSMLEKHLRPAFADYRSDRLPHAAIDEWVRSLAHRIGERTLSAKTYNNLLNLLHAILAWARHPARAFLSHDPLMGQKRVEVREAERDFLEPGEIQILLDAAATGPRGEVEGARVDPILDYMVLHLACYAGLRRGELFGLRWSDIEEAGEGGRIHIRRAIYQGVVGTSKTKNSERVVDVTRRTIEELAVYRLTHPSVGEEGYVFRTPKETKEGEIRGVPIDPDNWFHRRFKVIVKESGLRSIGLHCLRHSYCALLIFQGANLKFIQKQLGHASITTTANIYAHLHRETSTIEMKRLEAGIAARPNPTRGPNAEQNAEGATGPIP